MDTARYIIAIVLVCWAPPSFCLWFLVHPFVHFWRRISPVATITILGVLFLVGGGYFVYLRESLLGADLGSDISLIILAILAYIISARIYVLRKKHLTVSIMLGVPEMTGGGILLTKGIYGRIRHPRYVEVWIGSFAYAAFANYVGAWIVWLALGPVLHLIVLLEERELLHRFGSEYEKYQKCVGRYLPKRG